MVTTILSVCVRTKKKPRMTDYSLWLSGFREKYVIWAGCGVCSHNHHDWMICLFAVRKFRKIDLSLKNKRVAWSLHSLRKYSDTISSVCMWILCMKKHFAVWWVAIGWDRPTFCLTSSTIPIKSSRGQSLYREDSKNIEKSGGSSVTTYIYVLVGTYMAIYAKIAKSRPITGLV